MLSKACKSVIVIVFLFFLINVDVSANVGILEINTGRFAQSDGGIINIDLIEKNSNQLVVASLYDERGNIVNVVKLNSSLSTRASWRVKSGTYKVLLVNVKTGEKEVHYAIL